MDNESSAPDEYVVARVRDALSSDARVSELGLRVAAHGDLVEVTGVVATAERQRAVGEVVREIVPDRRVRNDTTVASVLEPSAPEDVS